jgi:hypothetical protein
MEAEVEFAIEMVALAGIEPSICRVKGGRTKTIIRQGQKD